VKIRDASDVPEARGDDDDDCDRAGCERPDRRDDERRREFATAPACDQADRDGYARRESDVIDDPAGKAERRCALWKRGNCSADAATSRECPAEENEKNRARLRAETEEHGAASERRCDRRTVEHCAHR
jgi:hypothetical protein